MLTDMLNKDPFKELFNGLSGSNRFQDGFEDGYAGRSQASQDRNYMNGYAMGYEHSEKESGNANQRTI